MTDKGNPCWRGYEMIGTKNKNGKTVPNCVQKESTDETQELVEKKSPAWQRKEGKNSEGGLNAKGRNSYEKENPGSDLKAPVTEKNPKGERKGRRDSFCARMQGMKNKLTGEKAKNDPDSRINKSLRKWKC